MKALLDNLAKLFVVRFCAERNHSMHLIATCDVVVERALQKLKAATPGFPIDDPVPEAPTKPVRPFPTDVPTPEPHDVPAPEPIDVPPPAPGDVPPRDKSPELPKHGSRPRPIP